MTAFLLDHLWQSTLFAAVAGLLTLGFRKNRAAVRYGLWFAASMKFLLPFSLLMALGASLYHPVVAAPQSLYAMEPAMRPFSTAVPVLAAPAAAPDWAMIALILWGLGFAAILCVWLTRALRLHNTARAATPAALNAPLPVKISDALLEPGLVGIVRPVLLLPRGILESLSPAEMQAVIAHELCHLRRRDNLMATLHMLVEALFWFHPLVWWLGARLIAERENACDESVIAGGNDPQTYAEGILKVCKLYVHSPLACAAGISGADLKKRMETIMENHFSLRLNAAKKILLAGAAVTALAAPLALGVLTSPSALAQPSATPSTTGPHSGTEAALRHQIEAFENKSPDFADLVPPLAAAVRQQQAETQKNFDDWGALKSITFREVGPGGNDVYMVAFANGTTVWRISPLTADGKIAGMSVSKAVARTGAGPAPGTEAAIRANYAGLLKGAPDYSIMSPGLVTSTQQQLKDLSTDANNLGPIQTLTFTKISDRGWDLYSATFAHGTSTWEIEPLTGGKINGIWWSDIHITDAKPHPGTEDSLRRYVMSLEAGAPNYGDMTPDLAAAVRKQFPNTLATIKPLGALQSISFESGGPQNSDTYLVTFAKGKVEWNIGPLTADGKAQTRNFHVL